VVTCRLVVVFFGVVVCGFVDVFGVVVSFLVEVVCILVVVVAQLKSE